MNHQEINLFLVSTKADILEHNGSQATFFLNPPIELKQDQPMYLSLLEANVVYNEPNIIVGKNNMFYFRGYSLKEPAVLTSFSYAFETGLYSLDQLNEEITEVLTDNCGVANANQFKFGADTATSKCYVTFKNAVTATGDRWLIDCTQGNNIMWTLGFPVDQTSPSAADLGTEVGHLEVANAGETIDSKNKIEINKLKSYIVTCNLVSNSYLNSNTGNCIGTFVPEKADCWSVYNYQPRHLTHIRINRNNLIDKISITFYTQDMEFCDFTGGNSGNGSPPETFIVRLRISSQISN